MIIKSNLPHPYSFPVTSTKWIDFAPNETKDVHDDLIKAARFQGGTLDEMLADGRMEIVNQ
ncbi:hypothetical protein JCM19240_3982 [Vibrio maritimus]|uniref:Uncharacterized protein n=1 Tax=Vibrio maritimus TaxID=990268 RepID=A0A090TEF4_9VIBR|nr:hypothetical protein JCM19240_3982 [Vibrio maritimus]